MRNETRLKTAEQSGARRYVPPVVRSVDSTEDPTEILRAAEVEAREHGFRSGYEEGRASAEQEAAQSARGLASAIDRLAVLRSELIRNSEQELLRLAIRVAEVVVREKIASDPEIAVRAMREALAEIPTTDSFRVRCHPAEEGVLAAWLGRPGAASGSFAVVADPSIGPGGCVVESVVGEIDVRLETQLRVIEHELMARS